MWWGIVNFILALALVLTIPVTKSAQAYRAIHGLVGPPSSIRNAALAIFSVLGVPLAVTYSIPFALASIFSSSVGGGQGLSLGLLNIAIVIPQMIVSVVSGGLDSLFGGGNLAAFVMGAIAAFISGLMAVFVLPNPPSDYNPADFVAGGGH
ncbi:hypothetical protein MLD38_000334 [Melastoma candidum]|uniref:Uncharacterized protein n=1 Tax=Melastoma candidum TaxID=119954 RepID=A0ACB9SIC3_9MYRT|nr:hypothetical protein MLD38_000334 [Melastoma candidum]